MTVPPVVPAVVADVLDSLPPRLRKRVDASLSRAAEWSVTTTADTAQAVLDPETTLTWTLHDGALTAADDLACSCLLAPKCLHRAIAVSVADIAADTDIPAAAAPDGTPTTADTTADPDTTVGTGGAADADRTADTDGAVEALGVGGTAGIGRTGPLAAAP
ncbi:hypothetical protein ACFQ3T_36490, partial [Saccharothrix hoggarensis]